MGLSDMGTTKKRRLKHFDGIHISVPIPETRTNKPLIVITTTSKEPKFENVKRDIEIFKPILDVPILLIGLE